MTTSTLKGCPKISSSCRCAHHGKDIKTLDSRIRDRFIRTNIDLIFIGIILALYHVGCAYASEEEVKAHHAIRSGETEEDIYEEDLSDEYAVFYPW